MEKTALASDLDGTLIFHKTEKFTDSEETYFKEGDLEAITAWQAGGGLFGPCSGRSVSGILKVLPDHIRPDFYIACSGAVILDRDQNVIYEAEIEKDDIRGVFEKYRDTNAFDAFQTDDRDVRYRTAEGKCFGGKEVIIASLEDIRDRKIYSASLLFDDEGKAGEAAWDINENCPGLEAFQNKNSVDIVKKGCSKGHGILLVKEYLNIHVMAGIGDSFNDIPMLKEASPSFTFHDSPESIRSQVTYVVDSVAEALGILGR